MSSHDLNERLHGTRNSRIVQEFFSNTVHFPIANLFLELLIEGPGEYFTEPDLYILMLACIIQAIVMGNWQYKGTPRPLLGNLIAPAMYTLIEILIEGGGFFQTYNHVAYWVFAFAIGAIQQMRLHSKGAGADLLIILENVLRAGVILVMYWIFGLLSGENYADLRIFFADPSHVFLAVTILLIGLMMGFDQRNSEKFLLMLQETGEQLRCYSEWLLGKDRLGPAMDNPETLSLSRRWRCVLFIDIRGFTRWSEAQSPEAVVAMLNGYCKVAEQCWIECGVIKAKLTGDEIMIVFTEADQAFAAAACLKQRIDSFLEPYKLGAGIGLHTGPLVEGLIGGEYIKAYDIIGDTVNTAKRLCDNAAAGEILLSAAIFQALSQTPSAIPRRIQAKGKSETLEVFGITDTSIVIR
ncbi:MAG: adenylate/guanylate cyclase domain-containing protein [Gammaproteobacteria bacterium]|nr:adenylate/guanylate cyclase domain-containing protein [Gammaproteobacteria bacterium]